MLNAIAPGYVSSAANPLLDFWTQRQVTDADGFTFYGLAAPYALAFQVWDVRNPDAPAQVFPATPGQRHAVNLTTDRIDGVDGHYAAAWTCSLTAGDKGRYQIRWFHTPANGAAEVETRYDFDVLPAADAVQGAGTGYLLVSDLRDEGVAADVSDARLLRVIGAQSRYVERVTSRSFRPVQKTIAVNGSGGRKCLFGEPLIALVGVSLGQPPTVDVPRDTLRVFNRHLSQGLIEPDDRQDPKIEFTHFADLINGTRGSTFVGSPLFGVPWREHYFPKSVQNVTVRGVWGYTDPDGGPVGKTPDLLVHAMKLLAMREIPEIGSDDREDRRNRSRITSERTRDQSYTREAEPQTGLTGEREIDDLLTMFIAPPRLGAV